jgi:hypothetical protein
MLFSFCLQPANSSATKAIWQIVLIVIVLKLEQLDK